MVTRRRILLAGSSIGAAALIPATLRGSAIAAAALTAGMLDPTTLPKYVTPLFILPAMARTGTGGPVDTYTVAARQFAQQILPAGFPATQVFGYGTPGTSNFHYPSYTIEARVDRPVRVSWVNQLVTGSGDFRPHLFAVDPTLHWANPPGGNAGRDSRPTFARTPGSYRGPVPMVTHLHGAHTTEENDGYPEAWYLPQARNIPPGFATVGTYYAPFLQEAHNRIGVTWAPGSAVFQYRNDQRATTMWFHSHTLGMTRLDVYAGLSGLYLLRGGAADLPAGVLPGPAPQPGDSPGTRYYELGLVIQDRSFNSDGSLFFPTGRGYFGDVPPAGPFIPTTDVPPIWNPEFFGNTMVVNGNTWPTLTVEPRRYRLRLLNACNTRVLLLKVVTNPLATRPAPAALPLTVIGADGGFLPAPAATASLRLAVAERADVIVDLTGVPVGTRLYLINEGPDEPYGGGEPDVDFVPSDPATTGQVMQLVVGSMVGRDTSLPVSRLNLPTLGRLAPATGTRQVSLNEMASMYFDGPVMGMLGTMAADGTPVPMHWMDPVTEHPALGSVEVWEMSNFTEDAHPIHLHLVQFEVVNRQAFGGPVRPPEPWETGTKDTLVALPNEITRVKARFDTAGRFVWHCHIIDHEDNEMMRPYVVG